MNPPVQTEQLLTAVPVLSSNPANAKIALNNDRRHDLDALRAVAMLMGILLHALMSFVPAGWIVQDSQAGDWAGVVLAAIHGFRMPLFFLISGFFTAMLWRNRGLRALLAHRFKRIFLPLLIGMFTIVPAVWMVIGVVTRPSGSAASTSAAESNSEKSNFDETLGRPLLEAALKGDVKEIENLISQGANVNATDERGSSAMHLACLFGYADVANTLLDAGGDPSIVNADRSRPTDTLLAPWGVTKFYGDLLRVKLDRAQVATGRTQIAERLGITIEPRNSVAGAGDKADWAGITWLLFYLPVFHHLWFLWFLCWLVMGFAVFVSVGTALRIPCLPRWMIVSGWRYIWLVPLVAFPQFFMTGFGPDTSIGLVPMPHVLLYYAIFFAFGVLYFDADDTTGIVGRQWRFAMPFSLLIVFPVAWILRETDSTLGHLAVTACSAAYVWLVSFGMMGLFRRYISAESSMMRYMSDSSYWLYLTHIPLIIYIQYTVADWMLTAWLKLPLICVVTSGLLLLSYHWLVRYSLVGTLLNGSRARPGAKSLAVN